MNDVLAVQQDHGPHVDRTVLVHEPGADVLTHLFAYKINEGPDGYGALRFHCDVAALQGEPERSEDLNVDGHASCSSLSFSGVGRPSFVQPRSS